MTGKPTRGKTARLFSHLFTWQFKVDERFSATCFEQIEKAVAASEAQHGCEIAFIVEASLSPKQIWRGCTARERALEMFGRFGVWDTEQNNGLLIYVLFAERSVELVVDRAIAKAIDQSAWNEIIKTLTQQYAHSEFKESSVKAIDQIGALLATKFSPIQSTVISASNPSSDANEARNPNEVPNRPISIK